MSITYRLIIFSSVLVAFSQAYGLHDHPLGRREASNSVQITAQSVTASPSLIRRSTPARIVPASATSAKSNCQPRIDHFTTPIGTSGSSWVSLSTRHDSYKMSRGGGVQLVLNPPKGPVTVSHDGTTNDKLGDGATLNSTFALLYGKITYTLAASPVPGAVAAAVMMGTKTFDEIDIEILGGDTKHWQTNVFRPAPGETEPLYGVFGGVETYPGNGVANQVHTYVVDWSPSRIAWSVDGKVVRTLTPSQTLHNGQQHYPSAMSRIQLGLWDASNPTGTSQWAKGPIPWAKMNYAPITAQIKSIQIECPY